MATNPSTLAASTSLTPAAASATPKPKTVANDMAARSIFPTIEAAQAYIDRLGTELSDFNDQQFATRGIILEGDNAGQLDPAVYTDEMDVMVAVLKTAPKGADGRAIKGEAGVVKAIVVTPVPKLDALLASDSGRIFVDAIIAKELNHRAVRVLRDADDLSLVIDQMPTTVTGYIESSRTDGGIMEAFNTLYADINKAMSNVPVWLRYRLTKSELRKCFESAAYALQTYAPLEDYAGRSLFEAAIELGRSAAVRKGLDATIFERWAATRDEKTIESVEADAETFDLDKLTALMMAEPGETPATPAAEGTVTDQPNPTPEADSAPDAGSAESNA